MHGRGNYYNEFDPKAAAWLRCLIADGLIPAGDVDERSIVAVQPDDLAGYVQCHFFAGIGGWSHALNLAGWPADRPIWTGSCPCQPFSVAGKGAGTDDERHLWPDLMRLIGACRPPVVMGEQVAGKAGLGWLDGVLADLEGDGYACRAVCVPACAVDAPHIRSRTYWCAVADPDCSGRAGRADDTLRCPQQRAVVERSDAWGDLGDPDTLRGLQPQGCVGDQRGRTADANANGSWWADADLIACHDGKARRAQSGLPMLVARFPERVAQWRGLGNAIVAPLAAEVIRAFLDTEYPTHTPKDHNG